MRYRLAPIRIASALLHVWYPIGYRGKPFGPQSPARPLPSAKGLGRAVQHSPIRSDNDFRNSECRLLGMRRTFRGYPAATSICTVTSCTEQVPSTRRKNERFRTTSLKSIAESFVNSSPRSMSTMRQSRPAPLLPADREMKATSTKIAEGRGGREPKPDINAAFHARRRTPR